jgi:hypothetical protein
MTVVKEGENYKIESQSLECLGFVITKQQHFFKKSFYTSFGEHRNNHDAIGFLLNGGVIFWCISSESGRCGQAVGLAFDNATWP